MPSGENWGERFENCLALASSVRDVTFSPNWPEKYLNRVSGFSAMGHAILRGQSLSAAPLQMLFLTDLGAPSYTATHAKDWAVGGRSQYRIAEGKHQSISLPVRPRVPSLPSAMKRAPDDNLTLYDDIIESVDAALARRISEKSIKTAMHLNIDSEDTEAVLDQILRNGAPQSLVVSEAFASVLAAVASEKYKITYAGQVGLGTAHPTRCYTVALVKS